MENKIILVIQPNTGDCNYSGNIISEATVLKVPKKIESLGERVGGDRRIKYKWNKYK